MSAGEDAAPQQGLKQRAVKGASWSLLDNIAQQVLTLVIFILLGRILSPALFGIVSTALVFVMLLRNSVLNSIATGLVALRTPTDEDYDTGFWLAMMIAAACFAALILGAGPLAKLFDIPEMTSVVRATAVMVLLSGLSYAHAAWARRNFMFRALAMRNTIGTLSGGAVAIALALLGYGIAALVANQLVTNLVALLLLWRAIAWRPKMRFSGERAKAILNTALPLSVNQGLNFVAQNFDTALVTYLLGPVAGGLYAVAKRIMLSIQVALFQPIANVTLPTFAEVNTQPERMAGAVARTAGLVMAIIAPLFIGLALTATPAIDVLFGDKWEGAAPVLTVLAGFGLATPALNILQQAITAMGKARWNLAMTCLQMLLAVGASFALADPGPAQIALCLTLPMSINLILSLFLLTRLIPLTISRYLQAVAPPLLCAGLMAAAIVFMPVTFDSPLLELLLLSAVGGITYVAACLFLARDAVREVMGIAGPYLPRRLRSVGGLS